MKPNVHFSSETDEWETPQELFDHLNNVHKFELDVCATAKNAKVKTFFTKEIDGLKQKWKGVCWMNPPYGSQIKHWIKKAYDSSRMGATVVCLIPARTDTKYWHDYVMKGEIEFIKGRLKFGGHTNSAPFPSAIVIFKGDINLENDIKVDELVRIYIKIRDQKDKIRLDYETREKEIDEQLKTVGTELLNVCKETGADSLKTQYGTATRKIHERYWTNDWASMYQIIKDFEVPELLEKRVHQTNIKQFLEEHPEAHPPGLNVDREYIISVRRKT